MSGHSRSCRSPAPGSAPARGSRAAPRARGSHAPSHGPEAPRGVRIAALGHEHDLLALARIRQRHGDMVHARPKIGRHCLDRRQRHHLAADLSEALGAPLDGDAAVIVDADDVARVVPAALRRLHHAGLVRLHVAGHHVRPLHHELAALLDALHRIEPPVDARQQPPDRAVLHHHRRVAGEHRRAFRAAVALEDRRAERIPEPARLFLDAFRTCDDQPHAGEIVLFRRPRIADEERIRAEEQRRLRLADEARDLAVMQRARIEHHLHAGEHAEHESGR